MDKLLNQLSQQSTWKGIILLATSAGIAISPEEANAITIFGLGLVGLINVFRNENKEKKNDA